jgi:sulfide:quinone oxidoreductase
MLGRGFRRTSLEVLVAGGGVAALEAVLALQALAGRRVRLTLVAPNDAFVYRPWGVVAPAGRREARRLPLDELARDVGAVWEHDAVESADHRRRIVRTGSGRELTYDALVIAVGAKTATVPAGALALDDRSMSQDLPPLWEDIDAGMVRSVAFVVASVTTWPLPAYEVALLTREHAREKGIELDVTIITPETKPLAVFGDQASAGVAEVLAAAGVHTFAAQNAEWRSGELILHPSAQHLRFDRVVVVPQLVGPAIAGLPADADGFLPITAHAEVTGVEGVYAAGDATDFAVKQGGIGAAQADSAAESIAARAGRAVPPTAFDTHIHGMLLTGAGEFLYLSAHLEGGVARESQVGETPTWSPAAKIAAKYLGSYLDKIWGESPGRANWHAWSFTDSVDSSLR